jgi:hypothetical protein
MTRHDPAGVTDLAVSGVNPGIGNPGANCAALTAQLAALVESFASVLEILRR